MGVKKSYTDVTNERMDVSYWTDMADIFFEYFYNIQKFIEYA
jgi:hypothetical protein